MRHVLAGERDGLAGLGIAPLARRTEVQREAAETADLDAPALCECIAHDLQNLLHRQLDVLGGKVLLLGCNELDEFRLGHARARCCSSTAVDAAVLLPANPAPPPLPLGLP